MAEQAPRFSIGEWYGRPMINLTGTELNRYGRIGSKSSDELCPFRQASFPEEKCNKKGGVCSMRLYQPGPHGVDAVPTDSGLVTLCPRRFWDQNTVFKHIGSTLLGCTTPIIINEVGFLKAPYRPLSTDRAATVGKIDMVLVNCQDPTQWCAVELQAVYFSGAGMSEEFEHYARTSADTVLFPTKVRRPDFRSSGPKRLMPQLEIKVPTIRRWGRKMAVVVDRAFFSELSPMKAVPHLSNADIAWFIVDYDPETGNLQSQDIFYTTLESSVEGLTAGIPVPLPVFQKELQQTLKKGSPTKVIRIE